MMRRPRAMIRHRSHIARLELEHVIALRQLDHGPLTFLQIGAYDGKTNDPLARFIRRYNWHGIMIEPQTKPYATLQQTHGDLANVQLINAAVADAPGERTLYSIDPRPGQRAPAWAEQLASFDRQTILKHAGEFDDLESAIREVPVKCVTFNQLLDRLPGKSIDVLQIDAEGYDYQLLKAFPFDRQKPGIIHFESRHLSEQDFDACIDLVVSHGYRFSTDRLDTLCIHSDPRSE